MEMHEEKPLELPFDQLALANTSYTTLVGFVSEPDGRGTLSLLFSCVFTLVLCVWSAVHLNLPKPTESNLEYTWRYLKWSFLGIFGPELVVWTAWRQHISARALTNNVKILQGSLPEARVPIDQAVARQKWTMAHSFYAGMGGFVIETNGTDMADGPAFIPGWTRLYLTPRAVMLLAECGLLPNITRDEIDDKSKSDGAQKLICCLQAGWMVVQAITRLAVGLPVTQLEINTIGHVLCALAMFILCQISGEMASKRDILRDFGGKPEISRLLHIPASMSSQNRNKNVVEVEEVEVVDDSAHPSCGTFVPRPPRQTGTTPHGPAELESGSASLDATLSEMQKTRWKLTCEAIEQYPPIRRRFHQQESCVESRYHEALRLYPEMPGRVKARIAQKLPTHKQSWLDLAAAAAVAAPRECRAEEFVLEHPRDWPADDLLRGVPGLFMGTTLWLLSMGFGAIHVGGWNAEFPSVVEAWLWRASSLYVISSGLLWSLINVLAHVSAPVWWFWYDVLAGEVLWAAQALLVALCSVGGSLYVVARMYLVVEAFASLRALPFGSFVSPSRVLTVPHL